MNKINGFKLLAISTLCATALNACGGGEASFLGVPKSSQTGSTTSTSDPAGGEVVPTVNVFLSDMSGKGQQVNPSVASIANRGSANIAIPPNTSNEVRFNQPAMVSEVCGWGADCRDENAVKFVEKLREQADKLEEDNPQKAHLNAWANKIESQFPGDGKRVIRDINDRILILKSWSTVDLGNQPSMDLGVAKINKKRMPDGSLVDYGGVVDRKFNGVLGFKVIDISPPGQKAPEYLNSYYRDPSVAGWSFQTFGYYLSTSRDPLLGNLRDQVVGYQTIGDNTAQLPNQNSFTYNGISHAFYNGNQVTSENIIDVDFGARTLDYKTTGSAILHTLKGGEHIIQERPDLNVSASATWAGKNRFEGKANTAGGLNGHIEGQFYGPNAEEVGGVYGLQNDTTQYVGGFGAKR
ncbi:transferrin-binding protein-like solute binding protein [Cardiobacteriaceae bacterium TAE3-ERU3]|nr:transferrin-binding protein-like solute binding protein [Cardiobacteriaceae bacterium TAE3-ERU3]